MALMRKAEYAKYRRERGLPGGSAPSVTYAVRDGRITTTPEGLIDPDLADRQWAENTSPAAQQSGVKAGAARAARAAKLRGESVKEVETRSQELPVEEPPPPIPVRGDFAQSRAAKEYYEAELARLKYEEKQKELIPASVVTKVLYEAGRIIRAGHDNIVSQLSPDLAAETNIDATERLLRVALDNLDNALADNIENLDLGSHDTPD